MGNMIEIKELSDRKRKFVVSRANATMVTEIMGKSIVSWDSLLDVCRLVSWGQGVRYSEDDFGAMKTLERGPGGVAYVGDVVSEVFAYVIGDGTTLIGWTKISKGVREARFAVVKSEEVKYSRLD